MYENAASSNRFTDWIRYPKKIKKTAGLVDWLACYTLEDSMHLKKCRISLLSLCTLCKSA